MDALMIDPQHAASSCWGDDLLQQFVVGEVRAQAALERAQFLGQLDLGSCTISFLADPARPGRRVVLIQTSSGDNAMIPSDIFAAPS